ASFFLYPFLGAGALKSRWPDGKYATIVVDPPWPLGKIRRRVRPSQGAELDYRVVSLEDIHGLPIQQIADDGAYCFLWTTHKFLREAFSILDSWSARYFCTLTWRKSTGV